MIRSPRRCSRTASISSGARSNITARAASYRPGPMSRTRSSASARGSASRPICAPPQVELHEGLVRGEPEPLALARRRSRRAQRYVLAAFPAGFYYKTFMWPRAAWKRVYEPSIRAHGGPRTCADGRRIPTATTNRYAHCDVLVVGGGTGRHRGGARRRGAWRTRHPVRRAGGARRLAPCETQADRRQAAHRHGSPTPWRT